MLDNGCLMLGVDDLWRLGDGCLMLDDDVLLCWVLGGDDNYYITA